MRSTTGWHRIAIAALLFVSSILAGCASQTATQDEVLPSKTKTATTSPTETPLPSPVPDSTSTTSPPIEVQEEIVIVYKRSGGFAGLDEQYTVYLDGRITTNDGREWRVEAHEVDLLLKQIEKSGFFEMVADYLPADPCCDLFFYELSVHIGDQTNSVLTVDGAPRAPDQLWELLGFVQHFLDQTLDQ